MPAVFYLGVDVSKSTLSVVLKDPAKDSPLWTNKSVSNTENGFAMIAEAAVKKISARGYERPFVIAIGMESTGVYGERLAHYFHGKKTEGFAVYVINPAAVRSFAKSSMAKNKNDVADAHVIAAYLSIAIPQNIVSPWVAPSEDEIFLSALSKRRDELVSMRAEETNRLEKLQNKAGPSQEALESVRRSIAYLGGEIGQIEDKIRGHVDKNPEIKKDLELMRSIPGIGEVTSVIIQSETKGLGSFSSARQLAAFAGLSPEEYSSGTSVHKRARISKKGNARIRRALYMCAMVAIRNNPVINKFYARLIASGKCKKIALVACMRKLLHILWAVVKHGKSFDPGHSA